MSMSLIQGQRLLMSQVVVALLQFIVGPTHSCNECYIGEIVQCATTSQKLFAHDDAAGTSLHVHKELENRHGNSAQLAKYLGPMWFLLGLCRAQVPHVKPTWVCNGPSGPRCPTLCPLGFLLGYMDDTNCVIKLGFNWVIWAEYA